MLYAAHKMVLELCILKNDSSVHLLVYALLSVVPITPVIHIGQTTPYDYTLS